MKTQPTIKQIEAAFGSNSIVARMAREDGIYPSLEATERRAKNSRRRFGAGSRYEARARAAALRGE